MNLNYLILQMKMYKQLVDNKNDLEALIDDIIYRYAGVRGIRYDKVPMTFNQALASDTFHRMSIELEKPQSELEFTLKAIAEIEPMILNNLKKFDDLTQTILKMKFFENKTYEEVGDVVGYSASAVWKKIRREVKKV